MTHTERVPRLFGTDGIRGIANREPMTSETVLQVGRALTQVFPKRPGHHKIVIGKDTRLSGYMLETALASGVCSMGGDVLLVGPMPTPGVAFLTRSLRADAGVVISASHNPFQDNGLKIFSEKGLKLPDTVEDDITALVRGATPAISRPPVDCIGKAVRVDDALGRYNVFVKNAFPRELTLEGIKVVIDCANGAAYKVAPDVLAELGADVVAVGVEPDGRNINRDCGALHPHHVQRLVREHGAQLGISLDGDADRAILIDETGTIVDGDAILAVAARDRIETDRLPERTVVATEMSNLGLDVALHRMGGRLVRTRVGDRYVIEAMRRGGYTLGGEPSGHVVFSDVSTTGDGLVTFLSILAIMIRTGQPLSALRRHFHPCPQVLLNIPVRARRDLERIEPVSRVMRQVRDKLGGDGRLVVRYSGTEPLLRIMVEGEDEGVVRAYGEEIADAVREHIGLPDGVSESA